LEQKGICDPPVQLYWKPAGGAIKERADASGLQTGRRAMNRAPRHRD